MSNRAKYLIAGFGVVAIAIGAIWWFIFRDDAPPEVSLDDAIGSVTTTVPSGGPTETTAGSSVPNALNGTWSVDTSADSFVGYRVQEELVGIGAKTAVGRTAAVSGTVEFAGTTMLTAAIEADLTQLQSDDRRRDGQLNTQAIETQTFPTASFTATGPADLGQLPTEGTAFSVQITGDLTLHGVTRSVTVPIEGQLVGDSVAIVGRIDIVFADYEIDPPSSFNVLSVDDVGEMEFQLFLTRG